MPPPTTRPQTKRSAKELRATAYRALIDLHTSGPQLLRECAEDLESLAGVHAGFHRADGPADVFRRIARLVRAIAELAELGPAAAGPPPDAD